MNTYVILLRGINVGGKNTVPMAGLRKCLEELGFSNVSTYIASGNVILKSDKRANDVKAQIEGVLPENFKLDDGFVKVLVLTYKQFQAIIDNKPKGFGEQPEKYHSDAIFLMGIDSAQAMPAFSPREGVDQVWAGNGVIYSQRLSSQRTKSRLNKIMETPFYKSMTIRNWNTTTKLLEILRKMDTQALNIGVVSSSYRFGSLQASLLVNPSIRLVDLADVYGYSDQAHLIREFKSFAHCTPRDFAASAPAYFELRQNEDWCDFMKQYFNLSYAG